MNDQKDIHAQAKAVFFKLLDEPFEHRPRILAELTSDAPQVRREVESLLTFAEPVSDFPPLVISGDLKQPHWFPKFFQVRAKRRLIYSVAWVILFLLLMIMGFNGRNYLNKSIEDAIGSHVESLVQSNAQAIDYWTESRFHEVRIFASDPQVLSAVQELISGKSSPELLRKRLDYQLQEMMKATHFEYYAVFDRNRYTIATNFPNGLGLQLNPKEGLRGMLSRIFEGESNLNPWRRLGTGYSNANIEENDRYFSWFAVPIFANDGSIIAGVSFGLDAEKTFVPTFRFGVWGRTGETYAFDNKGLMVSKSRFEEKLSKYLPILRLNTIADRIEIRNPGLDLTTGSLPVLKSGEWPFTRPIMQALDVASQELNQVSSGVITVPYRNYLGIEVIGAWVWLPKQNLGVLSEIEADEVLAIAHLVDKVYIVLSFIAFSAILLACGSWLISRRLGHAARFGQLMGQYRIVRKIAEGGAGEIFLAHHQILKRPTAIKILRTDSSDPHALARFESEVRAMTRLSHPNTIMVFDYGHTLDGAIYYAMEYLHGISLARMIEIEPNIPFERIVHILRQVASSLREAHSIGLVHRDIKPLNILICRIGGEYDVVKVVDFGLARPFKALGLNEMAGVAEANLLGTPAYIAPEAIEYPEKISSSMDIYAFGVVAYKLLVARHPFEALTEIALLYDTLYTPPKPVTEMRSGIPQQLSELIMRCLEKSPQNRPASMQEIVDLLANIKDLPTWSQVDARRWWSLRDHLLTDSLN